MTRLTITTILFFGLQAAVLGMPVTPNMLFDGMTFIDTAFEDDANAASLGSYWVFNGMAGDPIDIDINRTAAPPDLAAVLFFGDITGQDADLLSPDGLINGFLFVAAGTMFGPLTVVDFEDDTEDDPFGGPFGDPRFTLNLPSTGTYTVLVAGLNVGGAFEITSTGISAPVPEPSTLGLFGLGLAGLVALRLRRRRRS